MILLTTISDIISLQISVFPSLPQVKQYLISNIVNYVHKLLEKLPNNYRLRKN